MTIFSSVAAWLLPVAAATASPAPVQQNSPDRTFHTVVDGVPISEDDVFRLIYGIFDAGSKSVDTLTKSPADMPAGHPCLYYAGRDPKSNREIVWQATSCPNEDLKRAQDEYVAAYGLAALDTNTVGGPWENLYHENSRDDGSRSAFGEVLSQIVDAAGDHRGRIANYDVLWIRRNVLIGMTRKDAYAALRGRGLVAYNRAYNPGVPSSYHGLEGCSYRDQSPGAWPYHGEPVPKRTGGCSERVPDPGEYPSATVTLDAAFTLECGNRIEVTLKFDDSDRVKAIDVSNPEQMCI